MPPWAKMDAVTVNYSYKNQDIERVRRATWKEVQFIQDKKLSKECLGQRNQKPAKK